MIISPTIPINTPNKSQLARALRNHCTLTLNMHLVGLATLIVEDPFRDQQPPKTHSLTPKYHPATTQILRATSATNQYNHNDPFHFVHMDLTLEQVKMTIFDSHARLPCNHTENAHKATDNH